MDPNGAVERPDGESTDLDGGLKASLVRSLWTK